MIFSLNCLSNSPLLKELTIRTHVTFSGKQMLARAITEISFPQLQASLSVFSVLIILMSSGKQNK